MISPGFFPEGVYHYFTEKKYGNEVLSASEKEIAQSYGTKRLSDFCTGRYCMRRCTGHYGFDGDILIGSKGMPLLPGYITASLSHSKNICGAVAGSTDRFQSLGLDIETVGRVNRDMWHLLFSETEMRFLENMDELQQSIATTVFFSMKEAFYKMQYPLTETFLDFHDVEIVPAADGYRAMLLRSAGEFAEGQLFPGSAHQSGQEIVTFCALPV